eukprot:TRINITY_DN28144_c0_g1_i1.p1 TRINITY_DN28144_c0_g1~~TRINITY_DN28144_c0_g1_i1.p1  ORF type:complete len:542 (-),score=126.86 TRINITY_DN28144_c0_g1_i1:169-1686(-)
MAGLHRVLAQLDEVNADTLRVVCLRLGGYTLLPTDTAGNVLRDGDTIKAVTYQEWLTEHQGVCMEGQWTRLERSDFTDDIDKWVEVGTFPQTKHLFVRFGEGRATSLTIVHRNVIAEGRMANGDIIARVASKDMTSWHTEAVWICENHVIKGILLRGKSTSDRNTATQLIKVVVKEKGILEVEEIESVQEPPVDVIDTTAYDLPPPESTGPTLDMDGETPEPMVYAPEGNIPLQLRQDVPVKASQSIGSTRFTNFFFMSFVAVALEDLAIVSTKAEYEKDGKWHHTAGATPSFREPGPRGNFNYDWFNAGNFNLKAGKSVNLAIRAELVIEGRSGMDNQRRARAHRSLPQPLRLRATLEDSKGRTVSIICEYVNDPLGLPTKESCQKRLDVTLDGFICCDDTEYDDRLWMGLYRNAKDKVHVLRFQSQYFRMGENDWKAIAFKAKQAGTAVFEMSDMTSWSEGSRNKQRVKALVDLGKEFVFGVQVELQTFTGSSTESFHLLPFE